jgi:integrase
MDTLLIIAKWLGKDFEKATKEDMENFVMMLQSKGYSEWTKHDYKVVVKKFWKWLRGNDEYPSEVKWIKTTIKKSNKEELPNEVYTLEEIEKLIEVANSPRNKLFVSLLYESGCRISELLNVKVKDITFEEDYAMVNVMGKTGNRSVPITKSIPYLKTWLNYEDKGKDDYLFGLEYRNAVKILQGLFEKAKIDKPCNPHQFRHSRASELAKIMTESQMNQFFGWTQASSMARVYVHLTGRDLIPKLITQVKTRKCLKCGFENPMDLKFCSSCLMPLDTKQFKERTEQEDIMKNLYNLARNDKEWLEFTTKRLQKIMK